MDGSVARFLLSGAAALLVVLAGVSLIALVWDSIPDAVKIGTLGLAALLLVGSGALLSVSRPSLRVAAATLTGTGGALGFVAIIGAVLLDGLIPVAPAFALMALWAAALLVLSRVTAQIFTAVISTIGALVTVSFAAWQAQDPAAAPRTWLLTCAYVAALAAIAAALSRPDKTAPLAAWYPATSMVVTGMAVLLTPVGPLTESSTYLAIGLVLGLELLLIVQLLHSSRILWASGFQSWAGADWVAVGAVLVLTAIIVLDTVGPAGQGTGTAAACLSLTALPPLALLVSPGPQGWRRRTAVMALGTTAALGLIAVLVDPGLFAQAIALLALAAAPAVFEGRVLAMTVTSGAGMVALATVEGTAVQVAWGLVGLVVLVAATVGLETLALRHGQPADPGLMRAPAWLLMADLIFVVPPLLAALVPSSTAAEMHALASGVIVAILLLLGLLAPDLTVRGLLTGRLTGGPPAVGPGHPEPDEARAWVGWVLAGTCSLYVMARADGAWSKEWTALLTVVALALGVLASRLLMPWIRQGPAALAIAGLPTVLVWWSVIALSGLDSGSVLMTIVVLSTGALCIVSGFRLRATALRHYGLTLVMVAVLKLATLDIGSQNSITRVLALALAGVVCFLLSLAYNKAADTAAGMEASPAKKTAPSTPGTPGASTTSSAYGFIVPQHPTAGPGTPTAGPVPEESRFAPPDERR
ncbi:MAG: DUF2339 domain-containing protein [Actinomyces sp.]|uniref:DUF2339 domain-containing protein n=1 Tax=Actinomyces sp. TaxID=29317 RepID=UPI0026DDABD8|nr:DUF2339 domain-containing protein [Actinomyces sp.]MDO4243728.1 DUF2339 domain-containing protein [Actinomyces sp.]